jgi:CubicO group peptidase (beta-lactamase class C family)
MRWTKIAILVSYVLSLALPLSAQDIPAPSDKELKTILKDFEHYAEESMRDWETPGMAVTIVRGDEVVYTGAFGVKTRGGNDAVTTETIFQIGSTSKAFTAALVAMLVDEGKVTWEDAVIEHVPDFEMYDPWVTREFMVEDLMAQRSGMPPHAADTLVMFGFDRDQIRHALRYVKPASSFRSEFAYQNNLFLVAAELVEKHTGKSWEENIEERIFEPLGMLDSSMDMRSFQNGKDVTSLHHRYGDEIITLAKDWPYLHWTYVYGPAGGINSNIVDMAQWLKFQVNKGVCDGKRLISEDSMDFMHAPKTIAMVFAGRQEYYCEAWVYRENAPHPVIWHNGGTTGCKTMVAILPEAKVGIVVLSNLIDSRLPEALAFRFLDMYVGNPAVDWSSRLLAKMKQGIKTAEDELPVAPEDPLPAMPLENYTGDYRNDVYGRIAIAGENENLVLTIGPKKVKMYLRPWNRDTFSIYWPFYNDVSEPGAFASFHVGHEGAVTGVTIDLLNEDGCGVFTRDGSR